MLALEFAGLFFVLPSLIAFAGPRLPGLPVLWVVSAVCLFFLRRDPRFDQRQLWRLGPFPKGWTGILIPFCVSAAVLLVAVRYWAPGMFLDLPKRNPLLWALILCLYPVFSVYPQGLMYRVFFHASLRASVREFHSSANRQRRRVRLHACHLPERLGHGAFVSGRLAVYRTLQGDAFGAGVVG
jgi:hypothetical protein